MRVNPLKLPSWRARPSVLLVGVLLLGSCVTTPVTKRQALILVPMETEVALGLQVYQDELKDQRLITSGPQQEMVVRVMKRLTAVADDPGFQWEVRLIDAPKVVNAFCLPGGKMAVYSGILPVAQDEAGLAVVMGHEIGHAVARHGNERMSQEQALEVPLSIALSNQQEGVQQLALLSKDLLLTLPWGRKQESEADHIGLIYMARAGYDPRVAIDFWKRMAQLGGGAPPEFLSTHPSDQTRVAQLEKRMPEALAAYRGPGTAPKPPAGGLKAKP